MKTKVINALNVISIILAFLIADAPRLLASLAPYPRACAFAGVLLGVVSSLARFLRVVRPLFVRLESDTKVDSAPPSNSAPPPTTPPGAAALVLIVAGFLLVARPAEAQTAPEPIALPQIGFTIGETGSCQLATAVSAFQINLKTKDVQRIAFLGGFGCTFNNWVVPYGATLYVGEGVSKTEGSAPQANLLFQLSNWFAFGPGVQLLKTQSGDYVFQGLLSFVGTLNFGGTPAYVKERAVRAVRAAARP